MSAAAAALVVYGVWLASAFGWRTLVQRRRTGDTGFRGAGLLRGSVQWWARLLFAAALAGGVVAPVAELAGLAPLPVIDHPGVRAVGLLVAPAGVGATLAAQWSMGASWRIGVDETERITLVTGGAFAVARNPIFTAMVTTAAGLTAMVPNLIAAIALVALTVAVQVQVRVVEEPYLLRVHGDTYRDYATRVGRFLPGVGRTISAPSPARSTWT